MNAERDGTECVKECVLIDTKPKHAAQVVFFKSTVNSTDEETSNKNNLYV